MMSFKFTFDPFESNIVINREDKFTKTHIVYTFIIMIIKRRSDLYAR